ncbi:glycoside hydrolase family 35 protein [Paramyrothecium foliicola]|nr:glycoside hydrolase family 35 protein [Paramyrothecium foliicola]
MDEIILNGNTAKILVTDFSFGGELLIDSTAEVLAYTLVDQQPVLALWVTNGESEHGLIVNFANQTESTILQIDNSIKVVLLDRSAASLSWVSGLDSNPKVPVDKSGDLSNDKGTKTLAFPKGITNTGENVLLVIQDTRGYKRRNAAKIVGNLLAQQVDHLAKVLLTLLDDSKWPIASPSDGFAGASINIYRSILVLDAPKGYDVALSLVVSNVDPFKDYRALLYVHGHQ